MFSVIIPTYNRADSLMNAINAVLHQRFQQFELIIVDDGSTDDTKVCVSGLQDARCKYYYQENAGVCTARNTGAGCATGDYLVFLDSDDSVSDTWLADFAEVIVKQSASVVVCNRLIEGQPDAGKPYRGFLAGTFAIKREVFFAAGMYDTNIKYGENTELKWRIDAGGYETVFIDKPNVIYNISGSGGGSNRKNRVQFFHYVTQKHAQKFRSDKRKAQTMCQVAGVDCFYLGEKNEGRRLLWKGYRIRPLNVKALLRAAWYTVRR